LNPGLESRLSDYFGNPTSDNSPKMASNTRSTPQKRKTLTLDLNNSTSSAKKARVQHILTSPDVQMLKLTSPELAEFLSRNPTLATPTPSGGYLFPKTVTEEQEIYAQGFEVALKNLQQTEVDTGPTALTPAIEAIERATAAHRAKMAATSESSSISPRPSSSASGSMDSADSNALSMAGRIKEEMPDDEEEEEEEFDEDDYSDDDASSSTSKKRGGRKLNMNPIDMVSQEKIKLERKRLRNRLAASKCRKRKLERISQLEVKVKDLKGENTDLANVVKKLKESVYSLKQEVLEHVTSGCQISMVEEQPSFTS
jgi:hypothetical protein